MLEPRRWVVGSEAAGVRLDHFVSAHLTPSRSRLQRWIGSGAITVRGQIVKPSLRLRVGDEVVFAGRDELPDPGITAEAGPLRIVYEDAHLAVVDKPAGLAVHPGAGRKEGTLAHRLLAHWPEMAGVGGPGRPGIVHRLDMGTTGAIVTARTELAYQGLVRAFAQREARKTYLAIVYGCPTDARGTIDLPIGRHPNDRKKMTVRERGRPAITHFARRAQAAGCSLLEIGLETGRTHQIRVHMKAAGHPLVGDPIYGEARWRGIHGAARRILERFPRPALHAWQLAFEHPVTGADLHFEAPVPEDLRTLWEALGDPWPENLLAAE